MEYGNCIGNGLEISNKPSSLYVKRLGMIALVLAVACVAPDSVAQTAKESIDVPPHSRLLLRAVGSGDQVYGCVNGRWALKAPDAKLLNQGGSVIGRHFSGPTWELNDGSWVKGKGRRQHRLLPMRPRCRGCYLSRPAVQEDWVQFDLSSVPGRTGEMRLTAVAPRTQPAEFLTRRPTVL